MLARLDFPAVNCPTCAENEADGVTPPCRSGGECWIPRTDAAGQRALHLYQLITRLKGTIDAETVCRTHHATQLDLELVAEIAALKGTSHGN